MTSERFQFATLEDLRDWLNKMSKCKSDPDLDTVYPDGGEGFVVNLIYRRLSDGSEVTDAQFSVQ